MVNVGSNEGSVGGDLCDIPSALRRFFFEKEKSVDGCTHDWFVLMEYGKVHKSLRMCADGDA